VKFRTKTILGIALIEGVLLTTLVLSVLHQLGSSNEAELVRRANATARLLSASVRDATISADLATLGSVIKEVMDTGDLVYVRVLDAQKQPFVERGTLPPGQFVADAHILDVNDGVFDRETEMKIAGQTVGTIQFGMDVAPLNALIAKTRNWAISISVLEMLLVAAFSFVLGTYLTRQLLLLRDASKTVASGDFSKDLTVLGDDELADTATAFNRMIDKLRTAAQVRSLTDLQLRRQLDTLNSLNEVAALVGRDHHEILRQSLQIAINHLQLDFGIISQIHDSNYKIVVQVSPPNMLVDGQVFPLGITYCSSTLASGKLLAIANVDTSTYAGHPCHKEFGLAAYIGIPLLVRGEVFGTLNFSSPTARAQDFDAFELEFIELLSRWTSAFLDRLQTLEALQVSENALRLAKEDAEAANHAKSAFLATMSHEIRTPMNGVLGMAQMLLMPDLSEDDRINYSRTILSSGQTLMALLNDILDLSKIEAGKFVLDSVVFDPEAMLSDVNTLFSSAAQSKSLQLDFQWQGSSGQRYQADAHRLRQMLSNLVGNALKFTHAGQVDIEAFEVERRDGSSLLEFAVSDTGVGISADKLDLLFKPFSQTDSSTTREFGGTGLGLSIVRKLAIAMGGDVGVKSEPGQGSRFCFRVWVKHVLPSQGSNSFDHAIPGQTPVNTNTNQFQGHVLVAEDNAVNAMVIESFLSSLGLSMTLANDGRQAVEAATRGATGEKFSLILMDLHMPVMDGYEAAEQIRAWEATHKQPRRPIVALTADAFEEDRKRCQAVGMDDFLTKPISMDALKAALSPWLSSQEAA
jgi:signal transduction histidine kinase/CheY-like chemotaxis protein